MPRIEVWDTYIPTKLGDTSLDYIKWKSKVLAIRDMPEYKLRKLWKLNYSPKDIENNKHWEAFPPQGVRVRAKPGMALGEKRGRALTARGRQRAYAQALLDKAQWVLHFRRLEPDMLAMVRADVETFKRLVESFRSS